jgi:hypothetical protein
MQEPRLEWSGFFLCLNGTCKCLNAKGAIITTPILTFGTTQKRINNRSNAGIQQQIRRFPARKTNSPRSCVAHSLKVSRSLFSGVSMLMVALKFSTMKNPTQVTTAFSTRNADTVNAVENVSQVSTLAGAVGPSPL